MPPHDNLLRVTNHSNPELPNINKRLGGYFHHIFDLDMHNREHEARSRQTMQNPRQIASYAPSFYWVYTPTVKIFHSVPVGRSGPLVRQLRIILWHAG